MKPTSPIHIPLTRGYAALVDAEDYDRLVALGTWCVKPHGRTAYAMRSHRDPETGKFRTLYMHRAITGWDYVDHINGDGLDNRRSNLREATRYQNMSNQRKRLDNTSGYIGVSWNVRQRRWVAYIMANRVRHHLGGFSTAEEAANVRDAAAREMHGEFAVLNFPAA